MKVTPSIFIEVTRVNPLISDGGSNIFFRLLSENIISVHFDLLSVQLQIIGLIRPHSNII